MEQAGLVKACLDDFCATSGQKVNAGKSRIFLSSNVNHCRKQEISRFLGFSLSADLGRYLGVPIHHKRAVKETYKDIMERVNRKLSSWKASNLSLAARHTLITSVISATPNYIMQTNPLPVSVCDEMDKRCRAFLWGDTSQSRKPHLVAWKDVCLRKEERGLGIRRARQQNESFMMK